MHDRLKSRREIPAVGKLLEQVDSAWFAARARRENDSHATRRGTQIG